MKNELLRVEDLKVWFDIKRGLLSKPVYVRAVDGVSFTFNPGESISLVGESGSGKTTLGKTILRLYKPTGGKIIFEGKDITNNESGDMKWYRRETALVQQDPFGALPPHFNIYRILEEPLIINNIGTKEERRDIIYRAMEEVRLTPVEDFAPKYPHMISGGQMQRVVIARALIMRPKLVIADEPVSMLDASVRVEILELLRGMQEKYNTSLIYITHDLATVRMFSHWIFIMYAGEIVERALTRELLSDPLHPYTNALLNAIPEPDPENRNIIKEVPPGEPPDLVNPPPGCRFAPRCARVMDICKEKPPELEIKERHWVKCWLYR
ncbi:MAG: ABC transporter ATP-binding protein [Dictyoglomi bacterium]|jgi:peptide/nickel transport system ATP-binding protein|nr:ABC transporter ATP-binding protein [Dictyoglomota bacterium]HHV80111.1 ABC transporter ATP-binding protein [bacterium]